MRVAPLLFALLVFTSVSHAESIGVFTATSGQVQVLRSENYLAAAPGVDVEPDDIVETEKGASAQLDMEDGSVLKLGPETRLALSDYRLDANKNVISATLDVLSGWLRFAVSKLKPEGRFNFNTPVLTIGVRGTEGTIEAQNEQGGLHLEEGAVDVTPFGGDITAAPPVRVNSGEFVQRLRHQPLAKLQQPPAAFMKRLPPNVQQKLVRRAQELKQRGVPPRVIRAITREDAKRIIERNPLLQEKLRERFKRFDGKPPLAPGKDKEGAAAPGIGGQILRERQLKTGGPSDPKEVSEALRQRFQAQQQLRQQKLKQRQTTDPALADKPPLRPRALKLPPGQKPLTPAPDATATDNPPTTPLLPSAIKEAPPEQPVEQKNDSTTTLPLRQPAPLLQPAPQQLLQPAPAK